MNSQNQNELINIISSQPNKLIYNYGPLCSFIDQIESVYSNREDIFRHVIEKYEISVDYANKMQNLQGFKISFIFDDSSSMRAILNDSPLNRGDNLFKATRWDELKHFANISIEIASIFNPEGCDVYFLNRGLVRNVLNMEQLEVYFNIAPLGSTPLTSTLNSVLLNNKEAINERKLLVIIISDGVPTDKTGNPSIKEFKKYLKNRQPIDRIFISIITCTDQEYSLKYLNKWDKSIPNLDVVDDFKNEQKQIRQVKGSKFRFSYGDYVVKSLIGSIDPQLDKFDEQNKFSCKYCVVS